MGERYRQVAETTAHFRVPRQRIILWRGSESDKTEAFTQALGDLGDLMHVVTCSVHKEPVAAAHTLHRLAQDVPDSVMIAFIGRSNGAGPTLSAMSRKVASALASPAGLSSTKCTGRPCTTCCRE